MTRLIHILTSFDIGGAEQFVLDCCRRFDRKRFDVSVVAVIRGGPMCAEFHEAGIPTEVIGKETRLGLATIRRLTEFLRAERPQIVHTHLFGGDTWGRIAATRAGVPHLVSTEHNMNLDEGFVKRLVKRILAQSTERIITVSDAVRAYSIRVDRIPIDRMVVIPCGIDLERFRPTPHIPADGPRFLAVGRLVPQKGHDVLIDALAILRDRLPRATLTIVGDGPLREPLEHQVRRYHLEDRVRFLGFRRDLPTRYAAADALVVPSRFEGLGIAAIEASACGLPVIASNVGGLQETIRDQETGILVPPGDPALLAGAMADLAADRPRRILMGHAGRRHAEERYDIRRIVARYEEVYEDALQQV